MRRGALAGRLILFLGAALSLACLTAPGKDQLKFSHQLHLEKAGARCVDCHNSALTSNEATDRNLPSEQHCAACHDGAQAPVVDATALADVQPEDRSYRFDHQFHLQLGNIAPLLADAIDSGTYLGKPGDIRRHLDTENPCEACHRGLRETDLATQANLPKMSDCLVCHSEVDNPFSCSTCHLQGADLKPASHTPGFLDLHSREEFEYEQVTCLPCHGRNFACMGCH